jgi:pimeloyl-ACP methyl ester carboxylesterase
VDAQPDGRGRALLTADGVRISAHHDPAPTERDLVFVVAHGFTGSWRRPAVRRIAAGLGAHGGVVSFDFRGHGRSGGASTVGDAETLDLDAAVCWGRLLGYRRVVVVGWSMGAAVGVRHAALCRGVDAVVAVSGPSRWHFQGTVAMRRLHRGVRTHVGRAVLSRAFGTRVAAQGWSPDPEPPDAVVGRIAPTPLLVVHGDADPYFPLEHALWLARAARPPSELWVEPGFGHAEAAATPDLVDRIARWARSATMLR